MYRRYRGRPESATMSVPKTSLATPSSNKFTPSSTRTATPGGPSCTIRKLAVLSCIVSIMPLFAANPKAEAWVMNRSPEIAGVRPSRLTDRLLAGCSAPRSTGSWPPASARVVRAAGRPGPAHRRPPPSPAAGAHLGKAAAHRASRARDVPPRNPGLRRPHRRRRARRPRARAAADDAAAGPGPGRGHGDGAAHGRPRTGVQPAQPRLPGKCAPGRDRRARPRAAADARERGTALAPIARWVIV